MNAKYLSPVVFSLLAACGGLNSADKDACMAGSDCAAGLVCISFVCAEGTASDTDGDTLVDEQELAGWEIVIDDKGFGLEVGAELLTRKMVMSDPTKPDTDGDGLADNEELLERSDPTAADTDGDGLKDLAEKVRWQSNLLSVDTDGDAKNPNDNTLPLAALFDGAEVAAGTSPTLSDTDGDARSDFEERDDALRDPRIAEIPQATLRVVGNVAIELNVEYSDAVGQEVTYGEEFATTEASRNSRSDMESTAVTIAASQGGEGFFDDLEFSKEGAIKFFGGIALELGRQGTCTAAAGGEVAFSKEAPDLLNDAVDGVFGLVGDIFNAVGGGATGACDPPTPETTNTTSTTFTSESSRSATETYSEYRTDSNTRTETASDGTITVGFELKNSGISAFTLVNPTVTVMQWVSSPSPTAASGSGAFRTLATLRAIDGGVLDGNGNRTFTLSPNDATIVQMSNDAVNADFTKDLLARPKAIFFSPAQFEISDAEGASFTFLTEETFGRTATLVIDDGVADTQRFQIATNVDRNEDGTLAGVRMGTVMQDILQQEYTTRSVARTAEDGSTVMVQELESIGNLANQRSANRGDPESGVAGDSEGLWIIYVKRPEQAEATLPFDDVAILPGDEVRLVYVRDVDGDGVMRREEALYGSSDEDNDSDGDGLSDYEELKRGWTVPIVYDEQGVSKTVSYKVTSNPTLSDSDSDGLDDQAERLLGTDPNNFDTDDDGISDRCEAQPLDADNTVANAECTEIPKFAILTGGAGRVLGIDVDGTLLDIGPSPELSGVGQSVVTSSGAHVYIGGGQGGASVVAHDFDTNSGAITPNPYPQVGSTSGLRSYEATVAHPFLPAVYVANHNVDSDGVYAYRIDNGVQKGRLLSIGNERAGVQQPDQLVITPDGRFLFAIGSSRELMTLGINLDPNAGEIGELTRLPNDVIRQNVAYNPVAIAMSPDGSQLFVSGTRINGQVRTNTIHAYNIDPVSGALTIVALADPRGPPQSTLRMVVHPSGDFLYALDSSSAYLFTINQQTGTVNWVDVDGDPNNNVNGVKTGFALNADDMKIGPNGLFAFTTTRGETASIVIDSMGFLDVAGAQTIPFGWDYITVYSEIP